MRGLIKFLCWVFIVGATQMVVGGNSASHTISIRVVRMNTFTIGEDDHGTSMQKPIDEEGQNTLSNESGRHLKWMTDQRGKKITVAAHMVSQGSRIQVGVVQCVGGVSVGEVPITDFDRDLITSISSSNGSCRLKYSALDPQAFGDNKGLHEIVYTITDVF